MFGTLMTIRWMARPRETIIASLAPSWVSVPRLCMCRSSPIQPPAVSLNTSWCTSTFDRHPRPLRFIHQPSQWLSNDFPWVVVPLGRNEVQEFMPLQMAWGSELIGTCFERYTATYLLEYNMQCWLLLNKLVFFEGESAAKIVGENCI